MNTTLTIKLTTTELVKIIQEALTARLGVASNDIKFKGSLSEDSFRQMRSINELTCEVIIERSIPLNAAKNTPEMVQAERAITLAGDL